MRRRASKAQAGSLLIITLWIITILSVVAVALARSLSVELRLTKYRLAHEQAKALARSGVYWAMQRLAEDIKEDQVDWLQDDWASFAGNPVDPAMWIVPVEGAGPARMKGQVRIRITDEERRLDLNSASAAVLGQFVGDVPDVGQAIVDYRDAADPTEDQPNAQPPYYAKNAPLTVLEEMFDIPALREHPEVAPVLRAETTVASAGKVNVNTASARVLQAKKGTTPGSELIPLFVERRETDTRCRYSSDAGSIQLIADCLQTAPQAVQNLVAGLEFQSAVFRVVAEGVVKEPAVAHRVEVIVKRAASAPSASQILSWKEG